MTVLGGSEPKPLESILGGRISVGSTTQCTPRPAMVQFNENNKEYNSTTRFSTLRGICVQAEIDPKGLKVRNRPLNQQSEARNFARAPHRSQTIAVSERPLSHSHSTAAVTQHTEPTVAYVPLRFQLAAVHCLCCFGTQTDSCR
jgi:hypothetical protein